MIFLWNITKNGKVWLDGDPLKQIISRRLPNAFSCQEITFVGDKDLLNIYITIPENDDPKRREDVASRLKTFLSPCGIEASVHWVRTDAEAAAKSAPASIWERPLFWAVCVGGAAALVNLGVSGAAWTALFAAVGFAVSWLFLTDNGRDSVRGIVKRFKDGGR